ncbi:MAG: hypothetical protein OXM55_04875 [Bdellovibrionales bacterium]|nr:hypothetical protein [Bdellovibrionales bacterium]
MAFVNFFPRRNEVWSLQTCLREKGDAMPDQYSGNIVKKRENKTTP